MSNYGGKRNGAGRKSKAEEQSLAEKIGYLESDAIKALERGVKAGEQWAIKMFFEYQYGKPKEYHELSGGLEINIPISEWTKQE